MHISYIDQPPIVAIDGEGVDVLLKSGTREFRGRCSRSLWRKFLELEIRRLNEWEVVERAHALGKVVPFKPECRTCGHAPGH